MNWNPKQLWDDFLAAAKRGRIKNVPDSICIEILPMPHTPPSSLPRGKIAVYVFSSNKDVLKVGQVGPKSQARYTRHHYNPDSSRSNLSKSLIEDEDAKSKHNLSQETVGEWIKNNTDRVNFIVEDDYYGPMLNLLEAFVQCRLQPVYEGKQGNQNRKG